MARQGRSRRPFFPGSRRGAKSARNNISHTAHHRRLRVEPLEDRRMLAVFTVDNLNDAGMGSLRQAIDDANANIGADTVEFQAGLSGTISLTSGEMSITDELTIDGPGADELTIDAQQNSRIFRITPASGPVTIEGLHLTSGKAMGNGGAIFSTTSALLSIERSIISGSSATTGFHGGGGGGIGASGNVTVIGSTISGNSVAGDFGVIAGGGILADGDIAITRSTISGNSASGGFLSILTRGGGVYARGELTITDSTISGNSASGGVTSILTRGGGVYAYGDVAVTNSTISHNSATGVRTTGTSDRGGAILSSGIVTVKESAISGNSLPSNFFLFSGGGGIYARGDATIKGSTISGNSATGENSGVAKVFGGGISTAGDVSVSDSTISDNSATADQLGGGGAISSFGEVTISRSTISGNSTSGGAFGGAYNPDGFPGGGGGIWSFDDPVTIENSIVAGNHTLDATFPDLNPGPGSLSVRYSLIGDNTGTGLAPAPVGMPDANGNLIGTAASPIDPLLGPLQDNGGPTLTHALLAGSPAINAGDPAFMPPPDFDQRGDGFDRVFDGRIDMGAFELQPVTLDERIEHLLDTGVLNRGQANSLLVKLNPSGNERAQLNRLRAFINEVNALVRAGILSAAEGQKLIDGAESLRMSLSVDTVLPLLVGRGSR